MHPPAYYLAVLPVYLVARHAPEAASGFRPGLQILVSGSAAKGSDSNTRAASFSRLIDGVDARDDGSDWTLTTTPTPGAPNSITE